ncbi:MAG: carbonic anhydrase [Proteobacteria bacterium]|nr:carbonic anhydrase [Pseudomonadota bacterium]
MPTEEALERLRAGHKRSKPDACTPATSQDLIRSLASEGQHPFATVITCSDSRVAPEILFHCRLGDIFTIRAAGNVLSDIGMGSLEYAVDHLHTPLILVLGHTGCGTVQSACHPGHHCHPALQALLDKITPAVRKAGGQTDLAEDINIENTMREILAYAPFQAHPEIIFGAKYDIRTSEILYLKSFDSAHQIVTSAWA